VSVDAVAQRPGWRAIPWPVWLLLVFAGLIIVRSITASGFAPLGALTGVAPVLLAAAVIYMAPADRRFVWAAVAIALPIIVRIIGAWLPDFWAASAPGDWKNASPLLYDLAAGANELTKVVGLAGVGLLGFAFGGVRTFMSAVILVFAGVVAAANVVWVSAQPIDGFPLVQFVTSFGFSVLVVLLWAFAFAAALESLRSLTLVGAGLVLANIVINDLLLWWQPGAGTDAGLLVLVASGPAALGWVVLIVAVMAREWNDTPARSRAGRGSSVRQRAG
jgi:hypothetical protein